MAGCAINCCSSTDHLQLSLEKHKPTRPTPTELLSEEEEISLSSSLLKKPSSVSVGKKRPAAERDDADFAVFSRDRRGPSKQVQGRMNRRQKRDGVCDRARGDIETLF